jgi:hypothetical protein
MRTVAGEERGMALVTAMVMLLALTLMGFMMMNTASLQTRSSGATREEAQALMLAEAGIARMKSFFTNALAEPRGGAVTYMYNGTLTTLALTGSYGTANSTALIPYKDLYSGGDFTALEWRFFRKRNKDLDDVPQFVNATYSQFTNPNADAYDADTPVVTSVDSFNPVEYSDTVLASFDDWTKKYGRPAFYIQHQPTLDKLFSDFASVGKVKFLGIYPPIGSAQSPGTSQRIICTIRAEVETNGGYTRTIEQELIEPPILPVTGSAQAGGGGAWDGSGSLRWGPVKVIGNDVSVGGSGNNVPWQCTFVAGTPTPNKDACVYNHNTDCYDKWFTLKVGFGNTFNMPAGQPANDCSDCIGCAGIDNAPASGGKRPYTGIKGYNDQPLYDAVTQPDGLKLDRWNQAEVKDWADSYNMIYTYDGASDKFYRGDYKDSTPVGAPITFGQMFDPAGNYIGKSNFVYIVLAAGTTELDFDTNKISGDYTKGTIYVDGNVECRGGGGGKDFIPPNGVKNPDQYLGLAADTTRLDNVNLEGVLYATGEIDASGGTIRVFGAILAETGQIKLSGSSEIWYDKSLIENSAGPKMPKAEKGKWREIRK